MTLKEEGTRNQVAKWVERGLCQEQQDGTYRNLLKEKGKGVTDDR